MISALEILRGSTAHPLFTIAAAVVMCLAIALLGPRKPRQRLAYSTYLLASSLACVIGGSWLMYFIHG